MNLPEIDGNGGIYTIVGGAIAGILWLRRKTSHDGKEIKKDEAERNTISFLIAERDKYMKIQEETMNLLRRSEIQVENLQGRLATMSADNTRIGLELSTMQNKYRDMRRMIVSIAPEMAPEFISTGLGSLE